MAQAPRIFDSRRLLTLLSLLLVVGFFATTLSSYFVSRQAIRAAILDQELPLASSNIYSEIQKDLVRPVLISSTMAHDTFLRDWILKGEQGVEQMARYLNEVKARYGAFSSFFVSERSGIYYTGEGVLKRVSPTEPRDTWYYRVRDMKDAYEINVDPDMANRDAVTIFINYRVFDYSGNYIGATGIGLTVEAVRHLIANYQQRYGRTIYFVDSAGKVVLFGSQGAPPETDLHLRQGLGAILDRILKERHGGYEYKADGGNHLLNVHYVPELKWYLFVEKSEDEALAEVRKTLYINLLVCLAITVVVLWLIHFALARYQRRLEEMASTDKLTGLLNRQAFGILSEKWLADYKREPRPISVLLADIDHFKAINDRYGHAVGDHVLHRVADLLRHRMRGSDIVVRWGGEEFLFLLRGCESAEAQAIAEALRASIEAMHCQVDGQTIAVTLSLGVSQYDGAESFDQTINRADRGLYLAKNGGRNQVCLTPAGT